MTVLDLLLLAMMAIGFIIGYKVGAVKQISFGAGVAIGLLQAIVSYERISAWMHGKLGWTDWICDALAFALIMAAIMFILQLAGYIVIGILKIFHLRILERTIGAIFFTYIAVLLLAAIVEISDRFSPDSQVLGKTSQNESLLYKRIVGTSYKVIEEAQKEFATDEEE